jgi:hypothetical protein
MISSGGGNWSWKTCDFPSLVYAMVKMGLGDDSRVKKSIDCIAGYSFENGWPCVMSREIQWFSRPSSYDDPCPIVNIIALKTLALLPEWRDSREARWGTDNLLTLWEQRHISRPNGFGMGKRFARLKMPFVWYDILHMLEALTMFPRILKDSRLREMLDTVGEKVDSQGRFTVESAGAGWREWEFGRENETSRWLTLLVRRIFKRAGIPLV